jgi:predicted amidohydrolase
MTDAKTDFTLACVQTNSGPDVAANVEAASDLVRQARVAGAELIVLPEVVNLLENGRARVLAAALPEAGNPALVAFQALAEEQDCWLLAGSLVIKLGPDQLANRSYLIDPQGRVVASYDKIHMFDVDLPGRESYRESATYRPGERAVVADTPWCRIGMTVCYDLRFAYLYRALAKAGARLLTVPSAFTRYTGAAHWHVLLRARAIETGCFVAAAAQCGSHSGKRETYGHSLVVDPWGRVLAEAGEAPGFITAAIDLAAVDKARKMVPAITHDRDFAPPSETPVPRLVAGDD